MILQEILQVEDIDKRIEYLKSQRNTTDEEIEKIQKQLDPNLHDVTDRAKRPMRDVSTKKLNEDGTTTTGTEKKEVNRIPFAYQDDIVNKRVSFLLSNPIQVTTASENKNAKAILSAIQAVNKSVKIDGINREAFRTKISYKEVAELWFTVEDEAKDRYGFVSPLKIKTKLFKPSEPGAEGVKDRLYPYFDDYGDLIAFSRGFFIKDVKGDSIEYFETWTNSSYTRLMKSKEGWQDVTDTKMAAFVKAIGKIPIVYAYQPYPEWYKVQKICERQDLSASNHGDINDRHASPILKATGEVLEKFGDVIQMKDGADMDYIAWGQANLSVDGEFNRLEDKIYMLTRTAKTSFESMKGMGNAASGEGQKMLFLDAHAECLNHMESFDPYLTRRYNLIKGILGVMNLPWKRDMVEVEIDVLATPYMMGGIDEKVRLLIDQYTAGMISLETACKMNPIFEDGLAEYDKIMAEKAAADKSPSGLDDAMNDEEN